MIKIKAGRNVLQLAVAQALLMSVNTLLITASAIIGFDLATNKSLATLPLAIQFLLTMLTTIPASLLMKRVGRKIGFAISSMIGIGGSLLAMYAVVTLSFVSFCLATALFGIYTAFGNYFRFAAAEVAGQTHDIASGEQRAETLPQALGLIRVSRMDLQGWHTTRNITR